MNNSGESLPMLFKTGGTLDLMIGMEGNRVKGEPIAGDNRLLVTRVAGKVMAALYRPVVTGEKKPVPFSSPWRTINFDRVDDVSDQVQLASASRVEEVPQKNGPSTRLNLEEYEFSIPLAAIGIKV